MGDGCVRSGTGRECGCGCGCDGMMSDIKCDGMGCVRTGRYRTGQDTKEEDSGRYNEMVYL